MFGRVKVIEANLGNIERVLRLVGGVLLFIWAMSQSYMNGIEWFVVIISVMLILNGIFSRCYLWFILEVNSCQSSLGECPKSTCY